MSSAPLEITPADTQGPIEKATRSRAPLAAPYDTSAIAEALPVLKVLTGVVPPSASVSGDRFSARLRESGSGNDTPTAEADAAWQSDPSA